MVQLSQPDFRYTELDLNLFTTSISVQTKWCVITGASCSGKTTVINLLANKGFRTVTEAGREFFEREMAKGRTIEEVRADPAAFTRQVYGIMLEHERSLLATETNFLDRALPDAFAFYRLAGMNPNDILSDCFRYRYTAVFLLNRLPYQKDGVRVADDETAAYLESWLLRDYSALGYQVIRVPVLSPEERVAFVLERLSERGLTDHLL